MTAFRFHPTVSNVACTSSSDGTVKVWDFLTSKAVVNIALDGPVDDVGWCYRGNLGIAVDKSKKMSVIDPRKGTSVAKVRY